MKNNNFIIYFFFSILVICMVSCSTNSFMARKNHQPRVRIEAQPVIEMEQSTPLLVSADPTAITPLEIGSGPVQNEVIHEKKGPNLLHKILVTFYPRQKQLIKKVFDHPKHQLGVAQTKEGGDKTTGLIINLLALAFGIAAILMVIGVAHGSVWVYFVVGLVLAAAAIIMGFIGKGMAWRGFGWLAGIIGIVAVVLLLIFMVLVVVVHTTF
jgi:hypothetical protein